MKVRRALSVLTTFTVITFAEAAGAQDARSRDVHLTMMGSPWWDVGYVTLGGAMTLTGVLALSAPEVHLAPLDGLGARPWRPAIGTVTDVVFGAGLALTLGLGVAVERWGQGARGWTLVRAPLILAESALVALGVVSLLKNIAGECRPRAWDNASATCVGAEPGRLAHDDRLAFPSGHTAPLAAMAGASLGMMLLPAGGRRTYWPLLAVATSLAATNLVLRVVAGAHSWVDTSAGFALGFSIGFGTAALHTYSRAQGPALSVSSQGVAVSGTF